MKIKHLLLLFFILVGLSLYIFTTVSTSKNNSLGSSAYVGTSISANQKVETNKPKDTKGSNEAIEKSERIVRTSQSNSVSDSPQKLNFNRQKIVTGVGKCVKESLPTDDSCFKINKNIAELIKAGLEADELQSLLKLIGTERNDRAKKHLWNLLKVVDGKKGAEGLKEYYFGSHRVIPPANFMVLVRSRFQDIAHWEQVESVLEFYAHGDSESKRRAFTLLDGLNNDKYLPLLEDAIAQVSPQQAQDLYLIITKMNSAAAYGSAVNIIKSKDFANDENAMNFHLNGLNFIKSQAVDRTMKQGLESDDRNERLASYVILQNFSADESFSLSRRYMEKEGCPNETLECQILSRTLAKQKNNRYRVR